MMNSYFGVHIHTFSFDDSSERDTLRAFAQAEALVKPGLRMRIWRQSRLLPHLCRNVVYEPSGPMPTIVENTKAATRQPRDG